MLALFPLNTLFAQEKTKVSGIVLTGDSLVLQHVSVMLIHQPDSIIISFTETDEKGRFQIQLPVGFKRIEDYLLRVSLLGFKRQEIPLILGKYEYQFKLTESSLMLKEVRVSGKFPVVKMNGDTTTYRVADFASAQDRNIGDVLKKIPGIDVEDNGQIRFNGQKVSRLYLDGDDLLENKYNLATRTIPHDLVNQIQVLENHQRVRALEGKVFSDNVDINLTFTDKAKMKLIGQVNAGGGLPGLYEGEANIISLKNKYKAISALKMNNTAKSLSSDILGLNALNESLRRDFYPEGAQLSTGTGMIPPIEQNRYMFNHSGLINSANLWKLGSEAQLKSKVYYQYDYQKKRYQDQVNILLPDEVINYNEIQNNRTSDRNIYGDMIFHRNNHKYYVNNKFAFEYKGLNDESLLSANGKDRLQNYLGKSYALLNEIDFMKSPTGRKLIQYYSYIHFDSHPESLLIDSLYLPGIFQTSAALDKVDQQVRIPTFFTNNYMTIQRNSKNFSQAYKLGLSARMQELNSNLTGALHGNTTVSTDSISNNLRWNTYKLYIEPDYRFNARNLSFSLKLPIAYQRIYAKDPLYDYHTSTDRLLPNTEFSIRYNQQKGLSGNIFLQSNNVAGEFLQSYRGVLLSNYRSVVSNEPNLNTTRDFRTGISFQYKNPVKLLFIQTSGFYQRVSFNTIGFSRIDQELSFIERQLLDNEKGTYNFQTSLSKHLFSLNSAINFSYAFQHALSDQLVNRQLFTFVNHSNRWGGKWNGRIGEQLRYVYEFTYLDGKNYSKGNEHSLRPYTLRNISHELDFEMEVLSDLYLKTHANLMANRASNGLKTTYFFADFSAMYKLTKLKADFSLEGRNLTNVRNYRIALSSLNQQTLAEYPLRSRMFIAKVEFRF